MTDEEQLIEVFKLLANKIAPEPRNTSRPKPLDILILIASSLRVNILSLLKIAGFWEQRSFWFAIGSTAAYFMCALIIIGFKIQLYAWVKAVITLVFISTTMLPLLSFLVLNTTRMQKNSELFVRKRIEEIGIESYDEQIEEQNIINQLCDIASLQNLKDAELRFNYFIEQSQGREQATSNFLPILALISIIWWYVSTSGLFLQPLDNVLSDRLKGAPGVFAIILYILKFAFESDSPTRIIKYKKYLYCLKQAQLKKNNTNP